MLVIDVTVFPPIFPNQLIIRFLLVGPRSDCLILQTGLLQLGPRDLLAPNLRSTKQHQKWNSTKWQFWDHRSLRHWGFRFSNVYLIHSVFRLLFLSYNRRQELLDCVTHMRLLAWLLHGSLSHFVHCQNPHVNCHPVKFEENTHIADYVLIILFSFAEQLKVCFKSLSLKS